jgi:hypothetical protein
LSDAARIARSDFYLEVKHGPGSLKRLRVIQRSTGKVLRQEGARTWNYVNRLCMMERLVHRLREEAGE